MTSPAAPGGATPGALSPARRASLAKAAAPNGGNPGHAPPSAARPGTEVRGAARTPAAHTAGDEEAEALADAVALIDTVDEKVASASPCACGQHEAVHECVRATGRKRWVLSVPPYVIFTAEPSREGGRRPRVAIKAFATEDAAWDFQAEIRDANLCEMRSNARALPLPLRVASVSRARRRLALAQDTAAPKAVPPAAAPAAQDNAWDDFDGAGACGGGGDADEAGPSTAPPRANAQKPKPAVVWRLNPEAERRDEETRLAEQYIGSRVCERGCLGTVKGIEADMEDGFRFNVRFDDDTFGDVALRDIKAAAAAAAAAGQFTAAVPAVPVHLPADDEVIVIDDDDDDVAAAPAQEAPPDSEATPAPAAPRRNRRKLSQPTKRGRTSPADAASPEETDVHAAEAPPAKLARRALDDTASPPEGGANGADDTLAAAPVLDLSAPQASVPAKLLVQITLKLTSGDGHIGKLTEPDVTRLLDKLQACDQKLLSSYVSFENHRNELRLLGDLRQLLRESA